MPLFCLAGLLVLPTSLALACHLEMASVEISCTQYRFKVTGVGVKWTPGLGPWIAEVKV
jgi:hypothetical protein